MISNDDNQNSWNKGEVGHRLSSRTNEWGATIVEFASISAVFFVLLAGIIDFGFGLRNYNLITQFTDNTARRIAVKTPFECVSTRNDAAIDLRRQLNSVGLGSSALLRLRVVEVAGADTRCSLELSTSYNFQCIACSTILRGLQLSTQSRATIEDSAICITAPECPDEWISM